MDVIKTGTKPEDRKWLGKCRSCKSEAMATEGELKHITHDTREGGRFSWEKCPVCGAGANSGYGGMLFYPLDANTQVQRGA